MEEKGDLYFKVLKILRNKKMTQMELAEKMNIKQASLSKILSGKNSTKISTLQKIADGLEVPLNTLIVDDVSCAQIPAEKNEISSITNLITKLFDEQNKNITEKIKRLEEEISAVKKDNNYIKENLINSKRKR